MHSLRLPPLSPNRSRVQRMESEARSSMKRFEEITRGWSLTQRDSIPQDFSQALGSQLQLCDQLLKDKDTLINDLQQVSTVVCTHSAHAHMRPRTHTHIRMAALM